MRPTAIDFSEEQIAALFGHEAAEDESPQRLKQYFFRSNTYDQVSANLALRILVGHKGIGKSALFQIAQAELRDAGQFAVDLRPNDVASIAAAESGILERIEAWKVGLRDAVLQASLRSLGRDEISAVKQAMGKGGSLVVWLADCLKPLLHNYVDTSKIKRAGFESLIRSGQVTVFIDDLDRGWKGDPGDIARLSALMNAVRDLSRESPGLRFRIALRSDVYFLIRTADESTDKLQGSVIWYSWTNHEILALLVKRIETFFGRNPDEKHLMSMNQFDLAGYLSPVMDAHFTGQGKWKRAPMHRVLMTLIRRRPRDLIKLLTLAARKAAEDRSSQIRTEHFRQVFDEYSQDRVQDTENEYRSELPDIKRLMLGFKPSKQERVARVSYLYGTADLLKKIANIEQGGQFKNVLGQTLTLKQLAAFLYKINFLIASKTRDDGYIDRKYFEEHRYLSSEVADFGYDWEVHPAYRWALQPDARDAIYEMLDVSADS